MDLNYHKEFGDQLKLWQENEDALKEIEIDYKKQLVKKYNLYIQNSKQDFKNFAKENNLNIESENEKRISAHLNENFKILIVYHDIKPIANNSFELRIITNVPDDYEILIMPDKNIYIPGKVLGFTDYYKPKTIDEIKNRLKQIDEETLFWDEKSKLLKAKSCAFSYHKAENLHPEMKQLKRFEDFYSLLKELLEAK